MADEKNHEVKLAEAIVKQESENAAAFLQHELNQELAVANSHSVTPIRVACIGGNEQYYRTVLTQQRQQFPDVEFVKFIPAGGNNAFFAIDSLNPDILLVAHDAPIQNAVQFFAAVNTQSDSHGVAYAEKYRDKRIVVTAPNDYHYAVEIRNHGVRYMVPMIDPRFHSVDINMLMKVIHDAYADIQRTKMARESGMSSADMDAMAGMGFTTPSSRPQQAYSQPIEQSFAQPMSRQNARGNFGGFNNYGMPAEEQPVVPHKVIGIYSSTGGAGKTTFATNLASILSKYTKDEGTDYRVCLVEYNLACRNIDIFFNIKFPPQSKKSITSIAQDAHALYYNKNEEAIVAGPREMIPLISRYTEHIPSIGLDIIPGIAVPLEIDNISAGFSTALFTTLRQMYDVVIVDLSADVAKMAMLETMNEIDDFYYVMPMDVPSIRNARVLIKFLAGYFKKSPEEIKVIMNKVDPENETFGIDQVTDVLIEKGKENCTPEGTIPFAEKDILKSINEGIPLAVSDPRHPVSQAIFSIALGINPTLNMSVLEPEQDEAETKKPGMLGKLFGKKAKPAAAEEEKKEKKGVISKKTAVKQIAAPAKVEAEPEATVASDDTALDNEISEITEDFAPEPEKKPGFFARLFGFGKKKNKSKTEAKPEKQKPKKKLSKKN